MEQVALFTETKAGRLTLDCTISTLLPKVPLQVFVNTLSMDLLHRRLGHCGEAALHRLLREDMSTGLSPVTGKVSPCDSCQLEKLTLPPHPVVLFDHRTTRALQLVVMDLAGSVKPRSLGGASYFLGLLDVFTRHSWVFTIKKKSDAATKIFECKCVLENQCKQKLLNLRLDNGGEFSSSSLKHQMAVQGVLLQTTLPRSPKSNALVERFNSGSRTRQRPSC